MGRRPRSRHLLTCHAATGVLRDDFGVEPRCPVGRLVRHQAPRKMGPTGPAAVGIDLKGRIPAGELSFTGRALGRLSDIGWTPTVAARLLRRAGAQGVFPLVLVVQA